jgi:ATP-dependent Clp protease ATP-binding subunit ClpC
MPKINVYLPDDLAEAVKETGVPVSAICQRALEQSVKRVSAIRALTPADLGKNQELSHFTARAVTAIKLAIDRASGEVGTEHLLYGILAEGDNLALRVLPALEISPGTVTRELDRVLPEASDEPAERFGGEAANALELAVTEAAAMGHNYIGCEHLLLGLLAEPDGIGGQVLRKVGADFKSVKGAVLAALAGYVHLRATTSANFLEPLIRRIEKLEERLK